MFYELAVPTWGDQENLALQKVIQSGLFTMGEQVAAFESEFAQYFGMKHAVMVNSGSSANLLAVASLFYKKDNPLKADDEVIVPALSWATTYHPLQQYGLKLRFVDIELTTLNIDVSLLEEALTTKTKAIVGVSILGNPAALDVLRAFADQHDLYFIEDNCESMDAELNGKKAGTFGDLNTYSFFFSHHISTMEGGMILTDDPELADICRSMRAHGWTRGLDDPCSLFERGSIDFYEHYRFILPGYNVRPIELSGAVGREQLKKLQYMTQVRRGNLKLFQDLFSNDPRFIIQRENGKSSAFSFTMILAPDFDVDREAVFSKLGDAGIGFRIITGGCFLRHDVIKYYKYDIVGGAVPNADYAHDRGFFVGNQPFDLTKQLEVLHKSLEVL
jgi:CDP-4-dehydro-6-deoxyglucose reductase, E1